MLNLLIFCLFKTFLIFYHRISTSQYVNIATNVQGLAKCGISIPSAGTVVDLLFKVQDKIFDD
jgi:hypothetical protein